MASEKKKRKVDKRLHWERGGAWLKWVGKLRGLSFFNASQRRKNNKIDYGTD